MSKELSNAAVIIDPLLVVQELHDYNHAVDTFLILTADLRKFNLIFDMEVICNENYLEEGEEVPEDKLDYKVLSFNNITELASHYDKFLSDNRFKLEDDEQPADLRQILEDFQDSENQRD